MRRFFGALTALLLLALVAVTFAVWLHRGESQGRNDSAPPHEAGAEVCGGCHRSEYEAWHGSHHARAMQAAQPQTVLGDFDGTSLSHADVTSRFLRHDGKFFINTDGPDGKLAEYEIQYTFGVTPLQQYLVALPGGRLQALPTAWDSRPGEQGGQRWFHLYPQDRIDHRDPLHWTGVYQNWNTMCADCHSTRLRHNYDIRTDTFTTRWSEINVACEACHGPGSGHVEQARKGMRQQQEDLGLTVRFDQRKPAGRLAAMGRSTSLSFEEGAELKACAVCHSRRTALTNEFVPSEGYDQHFLPAALRSELYHVDGQIKDEVYEYNSFRQSKMFAKGVTCSDCHEPHTLSLRGDVQTVCGQCHEPARYAQAQHHHHRFEGSVRCVDCHMPRHSYMVVDPRRDHSFRVPRPDLSVRYGVPNPCAECHRENGAEWAAASVRTWLGRDARGFQQFADTVHAVRETTAQAEPLLQELLRDPLVPPVVKGSLLAEGSRFLYAVSDELRRSLKSPFIPERLGSMMAIERLPADVRWELGKHLLEDPARNVRVEAARILAERDLDAGRRARLAKPLGELLAAAALYGTMPDWRLIAADVQAKLGDDARAVAEFEAALSLQPGLGRTYANLADFYRAGGQEDRVKETLERGLKVLPAEASLHYALGLHYVRVKDLRRAIGELERAAQLAPEDAGFAYGYALGLHSRGDKAAALSYLAKRLTRFPHDRDNLYLLIQLASEMRRQDLVRAHRGTLAELARFDPAARQLLETLR